MAYQIQELIDLVAKLRSPEGCPWDQKQTYQSMIPCLLEESYEVIEAIKSEHTASLREELGDLLLQVVFLSQLAKEDQRFTFNDVVNDLAEKLIRRHPHIFEDKTANNEQEALVLWNKIKEMESGLKGDKSLLDNIPKALPALMRAEKLQKRCAKVGFDWPTVEQVFSKVEEEFSEVMQAVNEQEGQERVEEEIGDLLFAVVNLARHLNCTAEQSLFNANQKFEERFRKLEQKLSESNRTVEQCALVELDILWQEIKESEMSLAEFVS